MQERLTILPEKVNLYFQQPAPVLFYQLSVVFLAAYHAEFAVLAGILVSIAYKGFFGVENVGNDALQAFAKLFAMLCGKVVDVFFRYV